MPQRIVILGAGFGGLYTYLNLRKRLKPHEATILLVNNTNYFLFTPLLHEVATGGLNQQHVMQSIREVIHKNDDDFFMAEVQHIDTAQRMVTTSEGEVPYDYLVVALGAPTNFYGVKGAKEHTLQLDNLHDAHEIRTVLIEAFEHASKITNPEERKKLLTFAVVGGGPTGTELAGEMADLFLNTFTRYYKNIYCAKETTIYLVQRGAELVPQFKPWMRAYTHNVLSKRGVEILLHSVVTEVTPEGVFLTGGKFIAARHVIWVAGVAPKLCPFTPAASCDASGRIHVNEYLMVTPRMFHSPALSREGRGNKNNEVISSSRLSLEGRGRAEGAGEGDPSYVFALGDNAHVVDAHGNSLPMLAQVAVRQAPVVAQNIVALIRQKPLTKFHYRSQGALISLGHGQAVGELFGFLKIKGPLAWFIWRTVYLFKFASWSKRVKIALDWTVNLFYPRDIAKLQ